MRLDNLKVHCRKEYGTTPDIWESAIADYQFESARADVDDETAAVIKQACEISAIPSAPPLVALPDPRIDKLMVGCKQLLGYVKQQDQKIELLVAEVEELKAANTVVVEPVPLLPAQFAGFEEMFLSKL